MNTEPVRIKRGGFDPSDFTIVLVPKRARTAHERTIDRELAGDRAVIQAEAQRSLDAMRLTKELGDCLSSLGAELASSLYSREDEITDPRVKQYAQELDRHILEQSGRHQLGFHAIAMRQVAEHISRPFSLPAPVEERRNLWQRVIGSADG